MPVFDFSNTPDSNKEVVCTYTTFHSNERVATPEKPILVLDNRERKWNHYSSGMFTNPIKETTFEFNEEDGKYKADILQIAHHGFPAGDNDAQIDTNKVINPSVCLLPVSDYNAYTAFDNFVKSSRFIFENLGVDEVIAGTPQRTITLPYTAPEYGKKELEKKYLSGLDNNGSRTWIFSGLNTANKEDFVYTILNTGLGTEVLIEMFFENSSDRIGCIKTELPGKTIKTICITDKNDVITDYKFFNWEELDKKGVPENSPFAVRFIANEPIVVSNKNHKATYYSPNR